MKSKAKIFESVFVIFVGLGLLLGPVTVQARHKMLSDSMVKTLVEHRLIKHDLQREDNIRVSVEDHIVKLEGTVQSVAEKHRAKRLASRVEDVQRVERVIPVNADAMGTIMELHRRAEAFGGTEPLHYVFPACEGGKIDPTGPQRSWRSAWRPIKKAAGVHSLRFHDLRHHAITELAESEASDQTTMSIAGHVSPKMLAHYSHVRLEAKRKALDSLPRRPAKEPKDGVQEGSYVTKNVTNDKSVGDPSPQVQEKTGGRDGIRTHDPLVANQVLSQLSYTPFEAPESKLTASI